MDGGTCREATHRDEDRREADGHEHDDRRILSLMCDLSGGGRRRQVRPIARQVPEIGLDAFAAGDTRGPAPSRSRVVASVDGRPTPPETDGDGPHRRPRRPRQASPSCPGDGWSTRSARSDPVGRSGRGRPPGVAADPVRDRDGGPGRPGAGRVRARRARWSTDPRARSAWTRPTSRNWSRPHPASSRSHARNPERNVVFGGTQPRVLRRRRSGLRQRPGSRAAGPATFADFRDYVRLIGALDVIHQEGGGPLEPNDLPVETRHLDMYRILRDRAGQDLAGPRLRVRRSWTTRWTSWASSAAWTATTLAARAPVMTVINTNSPLRLDGPMGDGLIEMATPWPAGRRHAVHPGRRDERGLTGRRDRPAERGGALPGRPRRRSSDRRRRWSTARSRRTWTCGPVPPAFGTPESVKGAIATGQMARRYGLPVAIVQCHGLQHRGCAGGLRVRDGRLGRDHGRGQPAVPGCRLAGGWPDRVVREADHRCRDPPDDVRGPPAR